MEIRKDILKKCGGFPLAAKTLGGILRFKREEREWEHVRDSEIWNLPQDVGTCELFNLFIINIKYYNPRLV